MKAYLSALLAVTFLLGYMPRSLAISLEDIQFETKQYRSNLATVMSEAAGRAGVKIDTNGMVIISRDDVFAANTAVISAGDAFNFAYLSFPRTACAQTLPSDFYVLETHLNAASEPKARFINSNRQVVATLPLMVEDLRARRQDEGKITAGLALHSAAAKDGSVIITLGICKCQYIFPIFWRRLHSVIVLSERACTDGGGPVIHGSMH